MYVSFLVDYKRKTFTLHFFKQYFSYITLLDYFFRPLPLSQQCFNLNVCNTAVRHISSHNVSQVKSAKIQPTHAGCLTVKYKESWDIKR